MGLRGRAGEGEAEAGAAGLAAARRLRRGRRAPAPCRARPRRCRGRRRSTSIAEPVARGRAPRPAAPPPYLTPFSIRLRIARRSRLGWTRGGQALARRHLDRLAERAELLDHGVGERGEIDRRAVPRRRGRSGPARACRRASRPSPRWSRSSCSAPPRARRSRRGCAARRAACADRGRSRPASGPSRRASRSPARSSR